MPDAMTATAPPAAAAPETSKAEPKKEPKPYKFEFIPGDGFSLDALLMNGYLQATLKVSKDISVTYRSRTVEQDQAVEKVIDPQSLATTAKFQMNEMTIAQMYYSLQALNGKLIPAIPPTIWTKDYDPKTDLRRIWIRNLATSLFDQIVPAMTEFERHAAELISPENVRSF